MIKLKSQVLISTYIFILIDLITGFSFSFLYKENNIYFYLLSIFQSLAYLIFALIYIKAIYDNNITYLNEYNTISISYLITLALSTVSSIPSTIYIIVTDDGDRNNIKYFIIFFTICVFNIYYKIIIRKYYKQINMECLPDEENENKVSETKVKNLTYILIALAVIALGVLIISTYYYKDETSSYILIPIATILIAVFYIIAVKKKKTTFMYVHFTMLYIYLFSTMLLVISFFIAGIVFRFILEEYNFSFWIEVTDLLMIFVAFSIFFNYNIRYVIKYKNQIKMGPIEKSRDLEANVVQTNIINN